MPEPNIVCLGKQANENKLEEGELNAVSSSTEQTTAGQIVSKQDNRPPVLAESRGM